MSDRGILTGAIIGIAFLLALLGGLGYLIATKEHPTDPRDGVVYLGGDVWKQCDGTTLLYSGVTEDAIPNSPECAP